MLSSLMAIRPSLETLSLVVLVVVVFVMFWAGKVAVGSTSEGFVAQLKLRVPSDFVGSRDFPIVALVELALVLTP